MGASVKPSLYPFLMQPQLHVKVWGGRKLATLLGKELPTDQPYGESWELHDTTAVANGPLAGKRLGELCFDYREALLGPGNNPTEGFPLLAKLLDARDWLSVQVHPNDEQARAFGDGLRGKTEAWYVVDADPGARLIIGVEPGTTRDALRQAIEQKRFEQLLVYAPVTAGDILLIGAGTIHALGPGILIYEIQQSSDLTYRFYDWGRLGLDASPRELHIEKSLAVANLDRLPEIRHTGNLNRDVIPLFHCAYFQTELYRLHDGQPRAFGDTPRRRFDILTCIEGSGMVEGAGVQVAFEKGQTLLVPASIERFTLSGEARVLRSTQPDV